MYTDGSCIGNPGPGGWAWTVPAGRWASGHAPRTTNQRMEVQAVLEALRVLPGQTRVFSDSTYVVNCFNKCWYEGWLKRDWLNSKRQPVANRDLWEPLIGLWLPRRDEVTFKWVKGHSGNRHNDLADALASQAANDQTSNSGSHA